MLVADFRGNYIIAVDLPFILRSIRKQFREKGIAGVFQMLWSRAVLRYHEWKYGIHTEEVISPSELGLTNPEFSEYGATDWRHLSKLLRRLGLEHQKHVFVDFGAGMGRALIIAAALPFKRVIGVEISPELTSIAKQNVERAKQKLTCRDLRVVTADASQFAIEPDMSIFYFFNPFHGRTLETVLNAIRDSLIAKPREAFIICRLPPISDFETQILQQDWLQRGNEIPLVDGGKYCTFKAKLSPSFSS